MNTRPHVGNAVGSSSGTSPPASTGARTPEDALQNGRSTRTPEQPLLRRRQKPSDPVQNPGLRSSRRESSRSLSIRMSPPVEQTVRPGSSLCAGVQEEARKRGAAPPTVCAPAILATSQSLSSISVPKDRMLAGAGRNAEQKT